MIRLPNGNVVKFSHTNRKHFTVGDPMAFPIMKMGNKTPKPPLPLGQRAPNLIQQCLGPPHAPPQTAARTVGALSHMYALKSPIGYNGAPPIRSQKAKVPLPVDRSPNPTTCLIPGPVRPMMPNGIRSAVFPSQCTGQTDAPTDRQIVDGKV